MQVKTSPSKQLHQPAKPADRQGSLRTTSGTSFVNPTIGTCAGTVTGVRLDAAVLVVA